MLQTSFKLVKGKMASRSTPCKAFVLLSTADSATRVRRNWSVDEDRYYVSLPQRLSEYGCKREVQKTVWRVGVEFDVCITGSNYLYLQLNAFGRPSHYPTDHVAPVPGTRRFRRRPRPLRACAPDWPR
ncbi:hypothetical protein AAFF_G00284730 [Aldrovandia affinis]|uniref:Uncharacterized protein n=1 Tax=Aldrovandia affinis TaxID=143900 RepID=A0AAD7TBS6_9TELE|nr:hypothetical protein AAFF_G00284730 [Aldrovandia affinis]